MAEIDRLEEELAQLRALPTPRPQGTFEQMLARIYTEAEELRAMMKPEIRVDVAAPVVESPEIRVDVAAPTEALAALTEMFAQLVAAIHAKETLVTVNVPEQPPAQVTVQTPGARRIRVERGSRGEITGATVTED